MTTPTPTTHRIERCAGLLVYVPVKKQPATVYTTWAEYTAACA